MKVERRGVLAFDAALAGSEEARRAFQEEGVVVLTGALCAEWVDRLRGAMDEALAKPTPLGHQFASPGGAFFSDMYLSMAFPVFKAFTHDSPIGALAAGALGVESVRLFTDELLVKEPHTPRETPWHHDLSYWPLNGQQVASLWIPLDPVVAETGALEFVPGSHRWEGRYHPVDFATGAARITSPQERPLAPEALGLPAAPTRLAEIGPGDAVLFHARTLHRAAGNDTATRRRSLVLRLAGPDVVWDPRPQTLPLIWAPRLAPGEPLTGDLFPQLWPPAAAAG